MPPCQPSLAGAGKQLRAAASNLCTVQYIKTMHVTATGTNNARLAGMLRNLASYFYKEPSQLFMVRSCLGTTPYLPLAAFDMPFLLL